MATSLVVRNVEASVAQALKEAAARHERSAEAQHREILRAVLAQPARRIRRGLEIVRARGGQEQTGRL